MKKVQVQWNNKFYDADKLEKKSLKKVNKIVEKTKLKLVNELKSKAKKNNFSNGVYSINTDDYMEIVNNSFDEINSLVYDLCLSTNSISYKQALKELEEKTDDDIVNKYKTSNTKKYLNQFSTGLGYDFYNYSNQIAIYFGFKILNEYLSIINKNIDSKIASVNIKTAVNNALSKGSTKLNIETTKQKKRITSLVDNAMIYSYEETQLQAYKDNKILLVVWVTEKDNKVCQECRDREGTVYDIRNLANIPAHPNCRCYYESYVPKK